MRYKVQEIANSQGLTLADLANKAKVLKTTLIPIWHNEESNPLVDTMHRLAIALNVTVAELLDEGNGK